MCAHTHRWLRSVVSAVVGTSLEWHSDSSCLCRLRAWLKLSGHALRSVTLCGCQCNDPDDYEVNATAEARASASCDASSVIAAVLDANPRIEHLDVAQLHLCTDRDFTALASLLNAMRASLRVLAVPVCRAHIVSALDDANLSALTVIRLRAPGPSLPSDVSGSRVLCAIAASSPALEELDLSGVSMRYPSDTYALRALLTDVRNTLKDLTVVAYEADVLCAVASAKLTSLTTLAVSHVCAGDSGKLGDVLRSTCVDCADTCDLSPSPLRVICLLNVTSLPFIAAVVSDAAASTTHSLSHVLQNLTSLVVEVGHYSCTRQHSEDEGFAFISAIAPNVRNLTLREIELESRLWKGMVSAMGAGLRDLSVKARLISCDTSAHAAAFVDHVAAESKSIQHFDLCVWPVWHRFTADAESKSGVALQDAVQNLRQSAPRLDMTKIDALVQVLLS
jgi:hypothetical protein